jgi:hypothetical protein
LGAPGGWVTVAAGGRLVLAVLDGA